MSKAVGPQQLQTHGIAMVILICQNQTLHTLSWGMELLYKPHREGSRWGFRLCWFNLMMVLPSSMFRCW